LKAGYGSDLRPMRNTATMYKVQNIVMGYLNYIENMAEVSVALLAEDFHPGHPVALVRLTQHVVRLVVLHINA